MEGWLLLSGDDVYIVKGDEQPLPRLYAVPRMLGGVKLHLEAGELCRYTTCSPDPCIEGLTSPILNPGDWLVVSPFDALTRLKPINRVASMALTLAARFREVGLAVGLTGSLAYAPRHAGDVDLIVYGGADDAYQLLRDLHRHGICLNEAEPWRLLEGVCRGIPYSIRLMRVKVPRKCIRRRVVGRACIEGRIVFADAYATPAVYEVARDGSERVLVKTYRLRFSEIPEGSLVRVCGLLEEHDGVTVLVPDRGGYVKPLHIVY